MNISWWRSWHGAPMDHKWAVIAARADVKPGVVSAIAWALIDYASQAEDRGSVKGFDVETYSVFSGFAIDDVEAVIRVMNDKGVITNGRLSNWEKRQPKREDETSTERSRKHRNAMQRNATQQNAQEKEGDTDTDTDTDRDKETEAESAAPFDVFQVALERAGILVNNVDAINAVNELVKMGATIEDIHAGIAWKASNNNGRVIYASSIVGPTRTAMQKRKQSGNGQKRTKIYIDADGNEFEREA